MTKILDSLSKIKGTILLFGGSFDPIQLAHVKIAGIAKKEGNYDAVVFIPSKKNPLKNGPEASDGDRVTMLERALDREDGIYIWNFEINSEKSPSFTVDTVEAARKEVGDRKVGFLSGSDVLVDLIKWKDVPRLFEMLDEWIVADRGEDVDQLQNSLRKYLGEKYFSKIRWLFNDIVSVSSSEIRERLARGEDCRELVEPEVFRYIRENKLYY